MMQVPFLIGEVANSPRPVRDLLSFKSKTEGINLSFLAAFGFVLDIVFSNTSMERKSYLKKKEGATFSEKVLKLALSIPEGRVATYGNISYAAGGGAMAAQSITTILGKAFNAGEKRIPFHRIVYADGRVWLNSKYDTERKKRYKKEGIEIDAKGRIKNFEKVRIEFK